MCKPALTMTDPAALPAKNQTVPRFLLVALASMSGCGGQGYVGDRCGALTAQTAVQSLPTSSPVVLQSDAGVRMIIRTPSGVGTRSLDRDFECCVRQEVESLRDAGMSCAVNCDDYRGSIGAAALGAPYQGELCNGNGGSASCTVFYSKATGLLVGTSSICLD